MVVFLKKNLYCNLLKNLNETMSPVLFFFFLIIGHYNLLDRNL